MMKGPLIFRDRGFLGIRAFRLFLQVKDTRLHRAYFSERYKHGCNHVTVGHWRIVLRWR